MKKLLLSASILTALAAGSAHAITVAPNGSLSGSFAGSTTTVSSGAFAIGTGTTSITRTGTSTVGSIMDPYLGTPNNLALVHGGTVSLGDTISFSSNTFLVTSGAIAPLTITIDSYTFTFGSETILSKVDGNIGLLFLGNLIADSAGKLTVPAAADFSLTFTQSAPGGAIGSASSIDSPPNKALIPEPATLAVLGFGVLGLALVRRRA